MNQTKAFGDNSGDRGSQSALLSSIGSFSTAMESQLTAIPQLLPPLKQILVNTIRG